MDQLAIKARIVVQSVKPSRPALACTSIVGHPALVLNRGAALITKPVVSKGPVRE